MSAVPPRTYVLTFAALLVLTGLTTAAAFTDLGPANDLVALAIAVTKTLLVAVWFMHLRWSHWLVRIFALGSLAFLVLLIGLTLGDYMSRGWIPARTP
jgi:cytochrome c oxidase subunit 4